MTSQPAIKPVETFIHTANEKAHSDVQETMRERKIACNVHLARFYRLENLVPCSQFMIVHHSERDIRISE